MELRPILDVHTHNPAADPYTAVRNLAMDEWSEWLDGNMPGRCSAGIHPWDAHRCLDEEPWRLLERLAADARLWAVGECGIDKNAEASAEQQLLVFVRQIELAAAAGKHLIIHCVKRWDELIRLRKRYTASNPDIMWIVHGFRGKEVLARQLLDHGFYLSFNRFLPHPLAALLPADRIFFETDTL